MLNKELSCAKAWWCIIANGVIAYHEISELAIFDTELVGEIEDDFYKGQTDILDIQSQDFWNQRSRQNDKSLKVWLLA